MRLLTRLNTVRCLFAVCALITIFASTNYFIRTRAQQQPQDDDVERVNSDLVLVNATVTDGKGKPVGGLRKADFKLVEDSQPQQISFFGAESTPFAAVILLDTSGSMEARMSMARAAAVRFVESLRPEDMVAVYRFDSEIVKLQDFSSTANLSDRFFDTRAHGQTRLYEAIVMAARELAKRPERRKAIVVLSDGADTASLDTREKAADAALAADAAIYGIDMTQDGTGDRRDLQVAQILKSLSEKSGGLYVAAAGGPLLRESCIRIVQELSQQYTIGYQPTNQNHDGHWRAIEIKLNRPELKVRARKGYKAAKRK
ncbi:MAG: VWA domain-containing protein [Pyrinomonadaceae bacterium]